MSMIKKISQYIILNLVFLSIKEIKGEDNLPEHSGYLIASNHASHIDPFIITSIIFKKRGKIVNFIGKKESLNNYIWKFIYYVFDVIPIDRNSKSEKPIKISIKRLKSNKIIGVFPEGTRTPDGKIHEGKTGVARMAIYSRAQVIPVAIKGTYSAWPKSRKFPRMNGVVKVNIGKPLNFRNYSGKRISKKTLRIITNKIMISISKLYLQTENF